MRIINIPTSNGIDDIKLLGETEPERAFIKQLAEAGTLSCISRSVVDSAVFRALSVTAGHGSNSVTTEKFLGKYNFGVIQNQNHNVDLIFTRGADPMDLNIYTGIKLAVKNRKHGGTIFEVTLGAGLSVIGANNNTLSVVFTAAQTKLLCLDNYYYDVLMIQPNSNVYYLEGKISVTNTGTR